MTIIGYLSKIHRKMPPNARKEASRVSKGLGKLTVVKKT